MNTTRHLDATQGDIRHAMGLPRPCQGTIELGVPTDVAYPDDHAPVVNVGCPGGPQCWCQHARFAP